MAHDQQTSVKPLQGGRIVVGGGILLKPIVF